MTEPIFHRKAQAEYENAFTKYRGHSQKLAQRFEAAMSHTLVMIASNPELYPRLDSDHRFAVLKRFPYTVIYRMEEGHPFIVAVSYSSQDPGYWQGR